MTYSPPLQDMLFVIEELCDLPKIGKLSGYEDATPETIRAVLDEAGKYASTVLSPLNATGDADGATVENGKVTTSAEWRRAYATLVEAGWNSPTASPEHGGMGLPSVVNACIQEMFQGANMAFQLCPMLTQGAIDAIETFADSDLQATYLPKMITGEWTGTMNLTEPQAGSDLAAVRSTATPEGAHFRIKGQKIFITYGDHDLTENIIHLVLARLPGAPDGVKGISLFIVPKFLVNTDGSIGARNDVKCVSVEHKLGIHASPTCTLSFGDDGGAEGYLVGEPNKGLAYMFLMMNNARLNVGIQGIGVTEHAYQDALAYAYDRKQGGGQPIINHADVQRMLGIMKTTASAGRILAYRAAASLDFAAQATDAETKAYHQRRVDLLIPIVKGFWTEKSIECTSLGVQVHGGMGYVEETGVAQHFRDARITTIYEGTTGIQALDLIGRKILRDKGQAATELVNAMQASVEAINASASKGALSQIAETVQSACDALSTLISRILTADRDVATSCATDVLFLFGYCTSVWCLGDAAARAAARDGIEDAGYKKRRDEATFFATQCYPQVLAIAQTISDKIDAGKLDYSTGMLAQE